MPPHEFEITNEPEVGGLVTIKVPDNVKNPFKQTPGAAVRILQFVAPDPEVDIFD